MHSSNHVGLLRIPYRPNRGSSQVGTPSSPGLLRPRSLHGSIVGDYTAHDIDDDARNSLTPRHDSVTFLLTESAARRRACAFGRRPISLAGNHSRPPSTNQSRLDRPAEACIYAIARPRDNNRRNVYRRRRAAPPQTARAPVIACTTVKTDRRPPDQSLGPSTTTTMAEATKIARRPFDDGGSICCRRRRLFTLAMS